MGDKNPIKLTGGTFYIDGKPIGDIEMSEITYTNESVIDQFDWPIKLNESAEFSCEISLPPRALTKLFGWKWYFKWHLKRLFRRKKNDHN